MRGEQVDFIWARWGILRNIRELKLRSEGISGLGGEEIWGKLRGNELRWWEVDGKGGGLTIHPRKWSKRYSGVYRSTPSRSVGFGGRIVGRLLVGRRILSRSIARR